MQIEKIIHQSSLTPILKLRMQQSFNNLVFAIEITLEWQHALKINHRAHRLQYRLQEPILPLPQELFFLEQLLH